MVKNDAAALAFGKKPTAEVFGALLAALLSLIVLMLVGEYLWNNVLAKVVTFVKPVTSMWQILGLYVLFSLLFC
jgi:hypothetical protein